jgi:hypothetical protein
VSKSRVISASFRDLTELSVDSYHVDLNMDALVTAVRDIFAFVTGHKPKFKVHGGSNAENLALQNIQVSLCLCCTSRDDLELIRTTSCRLVCEWCLPTSSRNCCLGRGASSAGCWYSEVPMSMKGTLFEQLLRRQASR